MKPIETVIGPISGLSSRNPFSRLILATLDHFFDNFHRSLESIGEESGMRFGLKNPDRIKKAHSFFEAVLSHPTRTYSPSDTKILEVWST